MEKIIEEIEKETESKISEIEKEAKKETEKIISDAEKEALRIIEENKSKAVEAAEIEEKRILSNARLSSKRKDLLELERLTQEIKEKTLKGIGEVRKNKNYSKKLNELIKEAQEEIEGKVIVRVNSLDASKIKKNKNILVKKDAKIKAGAIIESEDGVVSIDNSFEEILERNWLNLKKEAIENLMK